MITLEAALQIWSNDEGSSHFVRLSAQDLLDIRNHARAVRRPFGTVKVEATIGTITWRTSVFPVKGGGYFLPVKIDVCRKSGISAGDLITVGLALL